MLDYPKFQLFIIHHPHYNNKDNFEKMKTGNKDNQIFCFFSVMFQEKHWEFFLTERQVVSPYFQIVFW